MNLNKINWIKSQLLPDESPSDVTSRLNTSIEIDNPIPQANISTPIDVDKLWDIVPPAEVFKVLNSLLWDRIVKAIEQNNKDLVQKYITALIAGGCLSPLVAKNIGIALSGEIPDPNWSAKIVTTPSQLAGFDEVYVHEAQEAIDA